MKESRLYFHIFLLCALLTSLLFAWKVFHFYGTDKEIEFAFRQAWNRISPPQTRIAQAPLSKKATLLSEKLKSCPYPRLANIFLKVPISNQEARSLAKWDVLVLGLQAQTESPSAIKKIRTLNPRIIILAYISPVSFPLERLNQLEPKNKGLFHEMAKVLTKENFLKDKKGKFIYIWPKTPILKLNSKLSQRGSGENLGKWLANFYYKNILGTGLWDGLFFDNTLDSISWINKDIDWNENGKPDYSQDIDKKWRQGLYGFLKSLKKLTRNEFLLLGNGKGNFMKYLNGRMFESFPLTDDGDWSSNMSRYQSLSEEKKNIPSLFIINSDTANTGNKFNFSKMRFGLGSALLLDGFYSFDWGSQDHSQLWWYDEYSLFLGKPLGGPYLFENGEKLETSNWRPGIWRRDFQNGIVLVNSTRGFLKVRMKKEYYKIKGSQDILYNDGKRTQAVILPPRDALILSRDFNQ